MTSELEKIDLIRARLGVSYKEAREALEKADGDVVQALVNLEEQGRNLGNAFKPGGRKWSVRSRSFCKRANVRSKSRDRTVYEFPATIGALGLIGALASSEIAVLGALGTVAAMANKYTLEFERQGERPEYENTSLGERPV